MELETNNTDLAPNLRSEERKLRIKSQWGFDCGCSLCTSPQHVRHLSDERMTLIEMLEVELNDLSFNRTANVNTAELLVALYEQERLDGVIGDGYMYAAFENSYVGNKRLVQKYAALAVEHMAIWRGTGHQYYKAMWQLFAQPEQQKSWNYFGAKQAQMEAEG
jgi:hypothetical protein